MVKKCFVPHEEVIYVCHEIFYILTIEKLSFHLADVRIIGLMECGKTRNDCFLSYASINNVKFKRIIQKNSEKRPV